MGRYLLAGLIGMRLATFAVCASAVPGEECADALREARELRTAGQLSAARARLAGCTAASCAATARQECAAQLAEVEAAMPAVTLVVKDGEGHELRGVGVVIDGQPLVEHRDGNPIFVEPGEHRIAFAAAGFHRIETTVVAHQGDHRRRVLVFLDREGGSTAPATADSSLAAAAATPSGADGAAPASPTARSRKKIAFVLGGAGAGVLVLGAVWGLLAKSAYDHALSTECGGDPNTCSPQGIADGRTAHDRATVATIAVTGGATLLAAAAIVYFIAPRQERIAVAPAVDGKGAGLTMLARW